MFYNIVLLQVFKTFCNFAALKGKKIEKGQRAIIDCLGLTWQSPLLRFQRLP